jgi:putative transposase
MIIADLVALEDPPEKDGSPTDLNLIDEQEWNRAQRIAEELRPWAKVSRAPAAIIKAIGGKLMLSPRQVQRYLAKLRVNPAVSTVTRDPGGRPRGRRMLDPRQEAVIAAVLKDHYLKKEPETISELMIRIDKGCEHCGVVSPCESAIRSRINALDGRQVLKKQKGTKAAEHGFDPVVGKVELTDALQLVQIDHTPADYLVVTDDEYREVLGRPWITLAIDVFTRCILGFYISLDSPSILSTALCICHAVLPKGDWLQALGVSAPWPMSGQPETIYVDNGADFRSHSMKRGCSENGIGLEWRPVQTPHTGGHIERLCGTLNSHIHGLPGTTFSNPIERGDYDSAAETIMTMAELREWLIYKICYKYHVEPHAGLDGRLPLRVWEESIQRVDANRVLPPAAPLEFMVSFLPSVWRPVHRTGVDWNTRPYWHPDLQQFIGSKEQRQLFHDPRDIRTAYMRNPAGRVVQLSETTGKIKSALSLKEDQLHRKLVRLGADDESSRAMRHMGVDKADGVVARARVATKKAKSRAAREKSRQKEIAITRKALNIPDPHPQPGNLSKVIPAAHRFGRVDEWE